MITVSTRALKDQLSSYLHRAEDGERIIVLRNGKPAVGLVPLQDLPVDTEESRLAALEARGLVVQPTETKRRRFGKPLVSARGKAASKMVIEDRR